MTFHELQTQLSLGEDSSRQFKVSSRGTSPKPLRTPRTLSQSLSSAEGQFNNTYRGLGSGIKRALSEWDKIDFHNDESGNLFTVIIHRKSSGKSSLPKTAKQIVEAIKENPSTTIPDLAESLEVTERAIVPRRMRRHPKAKQLKAFRESSITRRIGPAKGGHWEVLEK